MNSTNDGNESIIVPLKNIGSSSKQLAHNLAMVPAGLVSKVAHVSGHDFARTVRGSGFILSEFGKHLQRGGETLQHFDLNKAAIVATHAANKLYQDTAHTISGIFKPIIGWHTARMTHH